MILSIIAAIGKNNELGKGNDLLWHMPEDMKYFRETTRGHSVIMGRKTFESLPNGPLPNRRNIVITRDKSYQKDGIEVVNSLEEAAALFQNEDAEVFVIGGGEIYKQAMDFADKLYITHIDASDKDATTFFPEIIPIAWNEISHQEHKKDEKNPHDYTFSVYEKFI
ncbi:MAG: dihydrofolate reductase [Candidatus Pacebacteria bacterium]|nr:dihydrofolate reductase [Candidatus Paceibacterota bacterium]